MVVTKETIIGDVLDFDPTTAQYFFAIGMHCLGAPPGTRTPDPLIKSQLLYQLS